MIRRRSLWAADTYPLPRYADIVTAQTMVQAASMPLPRKDGILVFVQSVSDYFRLELGGSYTPDGVNVLATSLGPGAYLERLYVRDLRWSSQPAWYIDPASGSNDNSGSSAGQALRTHQELEARLDRINQSIFVQYLGQPALDDYIRVNFLSDRHTTAPFDSPIIEYRGIRTPLLSSTFTALAAPTRTALVPEATLVTDASVASFAPYEGKCIVVTSGAAAGATAWIAKGVAAHQARTSLFYYADPFIATPAPLPAQGDSYQICSLMDMPVATVSSPMLVLFKSMHVPSGCDFEMGLTFFGGCHVDDCPLKGVFGMTGSNLTIGNFSTQIFDGVTTFDGCFFSTVRHFYLDGPIFVEVARSLFQAQGGGTTAITLGFLDPGGTMSMTDVGFFDFDRVVELAGAASLNLNNGPYPIAGPSLWGAGLTSGVNTNGNATLQHGDGGGLPANYPNLAGTGASSLMLAGVNKPWTDIPFQDPTTGVSAIKFTP